MNTKNLDLSLIVTCYNEGYFIEDSLNKIGQTLKNSKLNWEIILVDDGSTDESLSKLQEIQKKHQDRIRLISYQPNRGRGYAVGQGFKSSQAKVAGFLDTDLEVGAHYIESLTRLILDNKAEMVLGRRIYDPETSSKFRTVFAGSYHLMVKTIFKIDYDTESGCKFFAMAKFRPILDKMKSERWFWDTEVMVRTDRAKFKIIQFPVVFVHRKDKSTTVKFIRDSIDDLKGLIRLKKEIS